MTTDLQTTTIDLQKQATQQRKDWKNMTLDDYIDYFNSHHQSILYLYQLRKIIAMHGFKSIQRSGTITKEELVEAVKSIELMEPGRSTLKNDEVTSSCAFITLEEAMRDLTSLKWQECCITSLQTINDQPQPALSAANTTTTNTVASVCSKKSTSKSDLSSSSKKKQRTRRSYH